MKPLDFILQDVFDIIKIIAIPVIGFFLYQFYMSVTALKKSVDKLIVQMQCRETYCTEKHKEVPSSNFTRYSCCQIVLFFADV